MWYEDLSKCDYFGEEHANILTSVGWLENKKPFPTGVIPKIVYDKLCELSKNPFRFAVFRGFHQCDLCQVQFEFRGERGISNIFIPHSGKIYVCPELITHYINTHFYRPPREFLEAVSVCPPMRSMEYLKKMLENGGRDLVELMKENK
jgi:hypothetical protein